MRPMITTGRKLSFRIRLNDQQVNDKSICFFILCGVTSFMNLVLSTRFLQGK